MPIVAMPDGAHVSFPDNMPPDQIRALIQSRFPDAGSNGSAPGGRLGTTFDAAGARAAGYTDAEIQGVHKALAAGYSPDEISAHLAQQPPPGFFLDKPSAGKLGTVQGPWTDFQQQGPWTDFQQPPPGYQLDQQPSHGVLGSAADFVKSIPEGAAQALRNYGRGHQIEAEFFNQPFTGGPIEAGPDLPTGLPTPQGKAGEYGQAVGEAIGNPLSYLGGGGIGLKAAGAVLSALGGKAGEDTGLPGGRLIGGVLGGVSGAKALGPKTVKAAVPTEAELRAAKDAGYAEARNSGVELDPQKFATDFAAPAAQHLTQSEKYAFTGGKDGTAPRTLGLLEKLQNPPEDAIVTGAGLDTLRKQINDIAGETRDFKPTADAKAAMVLKRLYSDYLESIPEDHVLAGSAPDYALAVGKANADNAAFRRVQNFNQKIANAEESAAGPTAPSLTTTLAGEARKFLKNPKLQRGYTPEEVAAVQGLNRGTPVSNSFSDIGRLGSGALPMALHIAGGVGPAIATGGASLIPQAALAATLYGSRRLGAKMTADQAKALVELLAKRSPLYQQRLNALPPPSPSAVPAAALRAIAASQ